MLARAISKQAGVTMLQVSGADIHQKYVGEGEKIARAIFTLGKKLAPCIVFIDEADSILPARGENDRKFERNLMSEFLRHWDSFMAGDGEAPFMLLATNLPDDLDPAVLRRVPARFLIDLPNEAHRKDILASLLQDETLGPQADPGALSKVTDQYIGSDLKNLCVSAAQIFMREYILKGTMPKLPERRVIQRRHFDQAFLVVKPTRTSPEVLAQIRNFDKKSPFRRQAA